LPKNEIAAVASFLRNIYTCDVDSLPTESLAHRYWTKFGSDHGNSVDYVKCLRERNLTLVACHNHTLQHCGKRFGEQPPARLAECNKLLWSEKYRSNYADVETRRRFERYRQCSADLRSKVSDLTESVVALLPQKPVWKGGEPVNSSHHELVTRQNSG